MAQASPLPILYGQEDWEPLILNSSFTVGLLKE
jgi:hypothetical protein